jgi:hypothetical protein
VTGSGRPLTGADWTPGEAAAKDPHDRREHPWYLIDCEWRKMRADQFLGIDLSTGEYSGLAEDWWQQSLKLGRRITHWIVEQGATQNYLYDNSVARNWARARGVTWVPHVTHRNRADPRLGVEALLRPIYRFGKVRLPGSTERGSKQAAMKLVDQVTKWRGDGRGYPNDLVTSQWFFEHQVQRPGGLKGVLRVQPIVDGDERPSWLDGSD